MKLFNRKEETDIDITGGDSDGDEEESEVLEDIEEAVYCTTMVFRK